MRNITAISKHVMRLAAILATVLVGTTYFSVSCAVAAGDDKKVVAVIPEVVHVAVQPIVKNVKVESFVKVVRAVPKATSDNAVFIKRVNPFFFRPFFFDADGLFLGD